MIEAFAWVSLGLLLLTAGGHFIVRSASGVALLFRLTPAVIGLTVVAIGTSLPELFVGLSAHSLEYFDLLVGNLVGSNILNIALVIGLSSMILPTVVSKQAIQKEWPLMFILTLIACGFLFNQTITIIEGAILILATVLVMFYFVKSGRNDHGESADELQDLSKKIQKRGKGKSLFFYSIEMIASFFLLNYGSDFFVKGSTQLAEIWGLSERVIGITVVAIGTSLPELVVSLAGTFKGRSDVAIGNILGSNIFNMAGILGVCAVSGSFTISEKLIKNDLPWLIVITVLLFLAMITGKKINRWKGALLFASYCIYTILLF